MCLYPVCTERTIKTTANNIKPEQNRTMAKTDSDINKIRTATFLQVLLSNFMDKHRSALDKR